MWVFTSKEQNMEGKRRLQEKLDEMTVTAAQQEFCDITCFSDVIRFDISSRQEVLCVGVRGSAM